MKTIHKVKLDLHTPKLSWIERDSPYDAPKRRAIQGKKLLKRLDWWNENIGGAETQGRTFYRYLRGECPQCGPDECDLDESCGTREEEALRIMGVCAKRHETTNYDWLLSKGMDKETARRMIMEEL